MTDANKCPFCKTYILGDFCFKCNKSIKDLNIEDLNIFKDIFGDE